MQSMRIAVVFFLFFASVLYAGNKVDVKKENGAYKLYVNGKQTSIRGVGCGYAFGTNGDNYLKLAKEMGAMSVRTWGVDQGDQKYLDEASNLGLLVDAGLWLNPTYPNGACSYITDLGYMSRVREEILDYVKKYKDHPAVLFWNVGNEVFINMKTEEDKIAFAKFLNVLVKDIRKIDSDHPTIYTSAGLAGLKYIVDYVPEIDIFGINLYGGIGFALKSCKDSGLNRPVIITELGPIGYWDVKKDGNGIAPDQNDVTKAVTIRNYLKETEGYKDILLGTYVFHLGETSQDSMTWWNLNYEGYKRAQFWEVYKYYTGNPVPVLPKILQFSLSKRQGLRTGEWVAVNLKIAYPKPEELTYDFFGSTFQLGAIAYYVNKKLDLPVEHSGDEVKIRMPAVAGLYRIYTVVKDKNGNAATMNVGIKVE